MFKVIMKDLILNRTALISNALIMIAFLVFMSSLEEGASPGTFAFFSGIMLAFVPVMVVTREDKFKAMALGCSLPVTRKTIVQSRYVLSVGSAVLGVLVAFSLGSLGPTSQLGPSELFTFAVVSQAIAVTTFCIALLLPFTFRFGAFGLILVLVFTQVLGIVALTLVKLTDSSADRLLIESIVQTVGGLYVRLGAAGFYGLLLAFLVAVLWTSYSLSVVVFRRREF